MGFVVQVENVGADLDLRDSLRSQWATVNTDRALPLIMMAIGNENEITRRHSKPVIIGLERLKLYCK